MSLAPSPLVTGYLLGWSIAWPPGPINAEIVRRGLARGFGAGFAVALGAATGDASWAIAVSLGAGLLVVRAGPRLLLGVLSTILLAALGGFFLRGASRAWRAWRAGTPPPVPQRLDADRAGYALGAGMALSSPLNVAFWLAVLGRPDWRFAGVADSLLLAVAVIAGTLSWCLILCSALALFRRRIDTVLWQIAAQGATGCLLLYFALEGVRRLYSGA